MFNIVGVLIALRLLLTSWESWLVYHYGKNWPNDQCLNCSTNANFKDYIKTKVALVKDNYELIEESNYFEEFKVDND